VSGNSADTRNWKNFGAASDRARVSGCREASEEAAGQAAAIVDHDPSGELAREAGLISNHVIL
jgi:hypothetical protein